MKYKTLGFILIYSALFILSIEAKATHLDKYKDKVKLLNKEGKLDSLIKSHEEVVLPFDPTNLDPTYCDKAAELINAYYWVKKNEGILDIVKHLKQLPDGNQYYIPKYNAHFLENTMYLFDRSKTTVIKENNLEMLRLARHQNDITGQLSALENLAYRSKTNNKDTFLYYTKLFGSLAESELHFKIYHTYMGEHYAQINTDSSAFHYHKALTHAINTKDSSSISSAYTHYSDFLSRIGKFEFAIENALQGLTYISPNSGAVDFRYINTYISITEIYKDMEDFVKAEEYINKAAVLAEKNEYKIRNKSIARILGETLFSLKKFDEAIVEFSKAEKGFEKSSDLKGKLGNLSGMAICYFELGDFEKSLQTINKIKGYKEQLEATPVLNYRVNFTSGNLHFKNKKYKKSISDFSIADNIVNQLALKAQSIGTAKSLGDSYTKVKDFKNANVHYQRAFQLREAVFNEDIINSTKELEAVYQKAEQEKEIFKLNAKNEANAEVLKQKNKTLTIGGIALLLISILSFMAFALYRSVKSKNNIIASALSEKDILLREIHHRVKNNLQVISSLLSLQSRQIEDEGIKQAINEGRNRVRSMALIHQNLYQKENLTGVSVVEYLNKLTSELFDTYNISEDRIKLNLEIQNIELDVETMVPLGLIINELVSNSLKHAFPQNQIGLIEVSLKEIDNTLLLSIKDDGIGTTQEKMESSNSFGNRLIKAFSNKLKAKFSVEENNGTLVKLKVTSYKKAS